MTNKTTERLYELKTELSNIKTDFKGHPTSKSRFSALVITKLEEAEYWLNDLIEEAIEHEKEVNDMSPATTGVTVGHLNSESAD